MPETRPPHPGRTPAQRKALDAIGCGQHPGCAPKTVAALLRDGLIVHVGDRVVGHDRFGTIRIPEYEMPIPVHMQWCSAVAATDEEMAEFEVGATA